MVGSTRSLLSPSRLDQSSETGTSAMQAPSWSSLIRISALQANPGSRMKPWPWRAYASPAMLRASYTMSVDVAMRRSYASRRMEARYTRKNDETVLASSREIRRIA